MALLLLCGFTAQVGTQYSRPGNFKLGASTSIQNSPTINTSNARTTQSTTASLSRSLTANTSSATVAEINPRSVFFSVSKTIQATAESLGAFVNTLAKTILVAANIATAASSMFTSQLGKGLSFLGNIILAVVPTQAVSATLNITARASATIGGAAGIVLHVLSAPVNTVIYLFFDIEAPPGWVKTVGATIGTSAKLAFTYTLIIPTVIMRSINTKSALVLATLQNKIPLSKTISALTSSVILISTFKMAIAKIINASAGNIVATLHLAARISTMVRVLSEPIQVALGHLTSLMLSIAASTASVTATLRASLIRAFVINTTRASVTLSASMSLARTFIVNASLGSLSASLREKFTVSRSIATSGAMHFGLLIAGHLLTLSLSIAASAKLVVVSIPSRVFSFIINLSRGALSVPVFSRVLTYLFPISSTGSVGLTMHLKAIIAPVISTSRASLVIIFGRTISFVFNLAATTEAVTLTRAIRLALSKTINTTAGSLVPTFTRALQFLINTTATHVAAVVSPLMRLTKTIATTSAAVSLTFHEAANLSKAIAASLASVIITSIPQRILTLTINTVTTSVSRALHFSQAISTAISAARATMSTSLRTAFSLSKTINAAIASLSFTLGRGIFANLQVAALSGHVVISDTIRALITGTIVSATEAIQLIQQIKVILLKTINAAHSLIKIIVAGFQPTPTFSKQVIVLSPLPQNQVVVAVGVLQ